MLLFRALSDDEDINFKKTTEDICEKSNKILKEKLEDNYKYMYKHILQGSFYKSNWKSLSKDYCTVYFCYSRAKCIRQNRRNGVFAKNIKIKPARIAVCNYDHERMIDVSYDKKTEEENEVVEKYVKWRSMARNYAKSDREVLCFGEIKPYVILNKFQMDILYILCSNIQDFDIQENLIKRIIDISERSNLKIILDRFNTFEKIIFELFYFNNMNLYEVIAPLYYYNESNILSIYSMVLSIIKTLLQKTLNEIFSDIYKEEDDDELEKLIKHMYASELKFICIKYKDTDNSSVDFRILLQKYGEKLNNLNLCKEIINKKLIMNTNQKVEEGRYITDQEYPIYLYLPKNKIELKKDYLYFNCNRDFIFNYYIYREYIGESKYGSSICDTDCVVKEGENKTKETRERTFEIKGKEYRKNIANFMSEIYIPDSYVTLEDGVFSLTESLSVSGYCKKSEEVVEERYSDMLVKIYGGKNLNISRDSLYENYFKNRNSCCSIVFE